MATIYLTTSITPNTQIPLDAKAYVKTLDELISLGASSFKAFIYYEGLIIYCLETRKSYEWREELVVGEEDGLLVASFVYPANSISNGIDYSGRTFNLFLKQITSDEISDIQETINNNENVYRNTQIINALVSQDKIHSGNLVWVDNTLDFISRNFVFTINGITYSPEEKLHTLAEQANDFGRIDIFVADATTGEVEVITGVPSANPQEPIILFGTQLFIGSVYVPSVASGDTNPQPNETTEFVIDVISNETDLEPDEWNLTETGIDVNISQTTPPLSIGAKYIQFEETASGLTKWKKSTLVTYDANGFLKLNIKLSGPLNGNYYGGTGQTGEGSLIKITLRNDIDGHAAILYGTLGTLQLCGLDNNSTDWQAISIPMVYFNYIIGGEPAKFNTFSLEVFRCGEISMDNLRINVEVSVPNPTKPIDEDKYMYRIGDYMVDRKGGDNKTRILEGNIIYGKGSLLPNEYIIALAMIDDPTDINNSSHFTILYQTLM